MRSKSAQNQFRNFLSGTGYSEQTIKTYQFHIGRLARSHDIENLNYKDIVLLISDPSFSLRYRQVIVAALKQYYHFLIWCNKRDSHPCPNLRIRSNYGKNFLQEDFLNSNELQLLRSRKCRYQATALRDKVLMSLLTIQGLSVGELTSLNLQHIKLNHEKIVIPGSRKYKQRTLRLLPQQIQLLTAYIHESREQIVAENNAALLVGMNGKRITADSVHYLVSTLKDLIPEKVITPSSIRQSVISWWINDLKIPLEQVQLMSGHRWISSTQKYEFRRVENDVQLVNRWQ